MGRDGTKHLDSRVEWMRIGEKLHSLSPVEHRILAAKMRKFVESAEAGASAWIEVREQKRLPVRPKTRPSTSPMAGIRPLGQPLMSPRIMQMPPRPRNMAEGSVVTTRPAPPPAMAEEPLTIASEKVTRGEDTIRDDAPRFLRYDA